MKKKLCLITSTRADYGFFRPLINQIKNSQKLELQLIATGAHTEKKYGNTLQEILDDGITPSAIVPILCNDSRQGIIGTMANATRDVGKALEEIKPDMVALIGDRYEIFSVASSCVILGIPIAHISGGDVTYGAYDDMFRHCITKMSYLHFTSCDEYCRRVIQLGENPDRVFSVGSLSVENLRTTRLLPKSEVETKIGFDLDNTLLATFHPTTMESDSQGEQLSELLSAIAEQNDYKVIFTEPNADTNREELVSMIRNFAAKNPKKIKVVDSLGSLLYLSAMQYCAGVIGNSSSGILETPSMKKATINIGNRQKGRVCAKSVVNCAAKKEEIISALKLIASDRFRAELSRVSNPYEQSNTAKKIVSKIEEALSSPLKTKEFFDLNFDENFQN